MQASLWLSVRIAPHKRSDSFVCCARAMGSTAGQSTQQEMGPQFGLLIRLTAEHLGASAKAVDQAIVIHRCRGHKRIKETTSCSPSSWRTGLSLKACGAKGRSWIAPRTMIRISADMERFGALRRPRYGCT